MMKRGAEWVSKNAKNMDYSSDMKFFTRKTVLRFCTRDFANGQASMLRNTRLLLRLLKTGRYDYLVRLRWI